MAKQKKIINYVTPFTVILHLFAVCCHAQLDPRFYASKCPSVESIASATFRRLASSDNVVAPSVLRLINHDCFIQGCDASILISSTPGNRAERDYVDNDLPQQAFDTISAMKRAVDAVCPAVVSCADLVVLAARESVTFLGGPSWTVPLGRRDSLISRESNSEGNIPKSSSNADQLLSLYSSKGLSTQDLVALSGAHTIGFSKCRQFSFRFAANGTPSMDPSFIQSLEGQCPATPTGAANVVPFDPSSPFGFDTSYFSNLEQSRGLLATDQVLFEDARTRPLVSLYASSQTEFFQAFVAGMLKMTAIGVLTGSEGEIRRDCSAVN